MSWRGRLAALAGTEDGIKTLLGAAGTALVFAGLAMLHLPLALLAVGAILLRAASR